MISSGRPVASAARLMKSSPLEAARQASVAMQRIFTTSRFFMRSAHTFSASMARSMASSESLPEAVSPSPRRTMRE